MDQDSINRVLKFLEDADQLKIVSRVSVLIGSARHESVAEHVWHMALFALVIGEIETCD